ncbi:MAG: cyclic nucleotide-binding domain-containing protein [Vicinamibacteria bacterium]|nr:cyclic nucleotide-binding domain-containing protein [Vicinamibacteria bacterium]
MRRVTLSKGDFLWEAGDVARNIGIVESGKLGIRSARGIVGLVTPKMVLGESALLLLEGGPQMRSAAVVALEDTTVTEYSASLFKQTFESGRFDVGHLILLTLIGQVCRNNLLVMAAHGEKLVVASLLRGQIQAMGETATQCRQIKTWDHFTWTFNYLIHLRENSDRMRDELVTTQIAETEALVKASEMMKSLVQGQDIVPHIEALIEADRAKAEWFTR